MSAEPKIIVDATPVQNAHRHRGVGTYVRGLLCALELLQSSSWAVLAYPGQLPCGNDRPRRAPVVPRAPGILQFHGGWLLDELWLPRRLGAGAVFHATDPARVPRRREPVIATVYDLTPLLDAGVRSGLWPDQRLAYQVALRRVRRANAIVAISGTVRDEIAALLGIPLDRVHVVYPSVPTPPRGGTGVRDSATPRVLFVGAPDPHKNIDVLLDAVARIPVSDRPAIEVVGPWDDDAINALHGDARRRRTAAPTVHAFASAEQLHDLYRTAVLLVMPSRREGFGLPVIEAMARGLPVIVADIPVLREVAGGAAWHVPVDDADALSAAIQRLVVHRDERERLAERGLVRAKDFSPQQMLTSLMAAYASVGINLI